MPIHTSLSKLDEVIKAKLPNRVDNLNPGLSAQAFEELERQLGPWHLPEECRALYEWHNGAQGPLELIPCYTFLSFEQAIEKYRTYLAMWPGTEGYNPVWFPIFSFESDIYCVTLSKSDIDKSPVYLSFNEDTEIRMMFSDLSTLIAVATRCFEDGVFVMEEDYLVENEEQVNQIKALFGDSAPRTHIDGENSYSKFFTQSWPEHWKSAIGRKDEDYELLGADNTVAGFKSQPKRSRVHVEIVGVMGTADFDVLEIEDKSGHMTVFSPRSAIGSRETQISRHYEMEVEEIQEQPPFGDSCEAVVRRLILRR